MSERESLPELEQLLQDLDRVALLVRILKVQSVAGAEKAAARTLSEALKLLARYQDTGTV